MGRWWGLDSGRGGVRLVGGGASLVWVLGGELAVSREDPVVAADELVADCPLERKPRLGRDEALVDEILGEGLDASPQYAECSDDAVLREACIFARFDPPGLVDPSC